MIRVEHANTRHVVRKLQVIVSVFSRECCQGTDFLDQFHGLLDLPC